MLPPNGTSLVIAVKNGAAYLAAALDSVARQTLPPGEVLLVDGGSTDRSREIAAGYPWVTCLPQSGQGLPDAWNQGVAASRGEYVAFLDSDDLWAPDKLRRQTEHLRDHPESDVVIGRVRFFLSEGQARPPAFKPELLQGSHPASMPGALLARRALFDRIGRFDPALGVTADIDWFARLRDRGVGIHLLPEIVIEKRVHAANLSYLAARTSAYERELLHLLRGKMMRARPDAAGSSRA